MSYSTNQSYFEISERQKTMQESISKALFITLTSLGVAVLATAGVVGTLKFMGMPTLSVSQTSTMKADSFSVTGESTMSVVPDQAQVSVGITQKETSVAQAQTKANAVINQIKTELSAMGIESGDIKTLFYQVNPEYDYDSPGSRRILGYSVSTSLEIKTSDFEKLNAIIDTATKAGANQVGNVEFTLSDDKKAELKTEARKEALEKAATKAQELAALSGMKLGRVLNVQEGSMPQPVLYERMKVMSMAADAGSAETVIEPGEREFSYTLTVSYETL